MKYIYFTICLLLVGLLTSCTEETTAGISRVTDFPIITINGDKTQFVNVSDSFVDEGAVSKEGEDEIETITEISKGEYFGEAISSKTPDKYVISYSAINKDGFKGNNFRTVWFYDDVNLNTSIEGIYLSDVQRAPSFTPSPAYDDLKYVIIRKTGDKTYSISHSIGGYYSIGRGYGDDYAAKGGTITINDLAANNFTLGGAKIPGWGLDIEISEFLVDAANNTITYTGSGSFGNGTFKVQLKKVEF